MVVFKLEHQHPLGGWGGGVCFLKPGLLGPDISFQFSRSKWEMRICISIKLLGDADVWKRYSQFENH